MRAIALPLLLLATAAGAQAPDGQRLFTRICAPCHGQGPGNDGSAMLPGTAALDAKYHGTPPAALERRDDLTPEVLRAIVRNGSGAMPMFRKTEIGDTEIDAIAAYLKRNAAK
jgi:mono/diheme cytochrome c family protein